MTSEQAGIIFNGLIVFAGGILVWLGTMLSRKEKTQKPPHTETMEIAGAIISGADAKILAEAFSKMSGNATALQAALERNTEAVEDVRDELRNMANVLIITKK